MGSRAAITEESEIERRTPAAAVAWIGSSSDIPAVVEALGLIWPRDLGRGLGVEATWLTWLAWRRDGQEGETRTYTRINHGSGIPAAAIGVCDKERDEERQNLHHGHDHLKRRQRQPRSGCT
nr:uncharacterized protein LOC127331684 [Lolium perenne]